MSKYHFYIRREYDPQMDMDQFFLTIYNTFDNYKQCSVIAITSEYCTSVAKDHIVFEIATALAKPITMVDPLDLRLYLVEYLNNGEYFPHVGVIAIPLLADMPHPTDHNWQITGLVPEESLDHIYHGKNVLSFTGKINTHITAGEIAKLLDDNEAIKAKWKSLSDKHFAASKPPPLELYSAQLYFNQIPASAGTHDNPMADPYGNANKPGVTTELSNASHELPGIKQMVEFPCDCYRYLKEHGHQETIHSIIQHLNDKDKWTREKIADWLDDLADRGIINIDLEDKLFSTELDGE